MTVRPQSGATGQGVLERFLSEVSIDEYAEAPLQGSVRVVRFSRMATWLGLVVAVLVGVVIATALLNTRLSTAERQQTRADLTDRVQSLSIAVVARQASVDEQSRTVTALQDRLLAASDEGPERAAEIAALSGQAATTEMAGAGLTVTIDDAPDAAAGSLNRVLDRDLQDIVNALWRGGSRGVAINGQRMTATTAIRAAGEAILVNYQPLVRPYLISSVDGAGNTTGVAGLLDQLSNDYGLVTDLQPGDVALPAGELRSPRYASTSDANGGVVGQ